VIVRTAALETLPNVAVMVAVVFDVTFVVLTVKVDDVLPAGIVTVAGTVAEESLLNSEIVSPPTGAAEPIATVPVLVFPPTTEFGAKATWVRDGGSIVSVATCDEVPTVAVSVTVVGVVTEVAFRMNVADV